MDKTLSFFLIGQDAAQHVYTISGSPTADSGSLDEALDKSVQNVFNQAQYGCSVEAHLTSNADAEEAQIQLILRLHPIDWLSPLSRVAWDVYTFFLWLLDSFRLANSQLTYSGPNPYEPVTYEQVRVICHATLLGSIDSIGVLADDVANLKSVLNQKRQGRNDCSDQALDKLNSRQLAQAIDSLERQISTLKDSQSQLEARLQGLQATKKTLEGNIGRIKVYVDQLTPAEASKLEAESRKLESELSQLQAELDRLQSAQTRLTEKLRQLERYDSKGGYIPDEKEMKQ